VKIGKALVDLAVAFDHRLEEHERNP
jgi:hypothetical protein